MDINNVKYNDEKNKNIVIVRMAWIFGLFIFMFIWFSQVHPLVVYDADDWMYIAYARRAIPTVSEWNPAKLFPEIILPLCTTVASRVIYPITGQFIWSITLVSAFVVSAFIIIYIHSLHGFLKRNFEISGFTAILAELLFLIFHFLMFREGDSNNTYLFFCDNLNCYYNYLLPALLNASIVLYMANNDKFYSFLEDGSVVSKGIFLVICYFAILSNLVDNIILGIYAGSLLLYDIIKLIRKRIDIRQCMKRNWFHVGVLAAWIVCAVFELNGRRANVDIGDTRTFGLKLRMTIEGAFNMTLKVHKIFILFAFVLIVCAIGAYFMSSQKNKLDKVFIEQINIWSFSTIVVLAYVILLCAKVNTNCIGRIEYLFSFCFYFLMILMITFSYIIKKYEKIVILVPLSLCILCSFVNTNCNTFREANYSKISGKTCMQISSDQVQQIVEADEQGQESISLEVSLSENIGNWPQTTYMGELMSRALYKHGVISRPMEITIVPSGALNMRYKIDQ